MTTILLSVLPQVFHHFTVFMGTNLLCVLPLRKRSPVLLPLHSLTGCHLPGSGKTPNFYVSRIRTVQVSPLVPPAPLPPSPPQQFVNRSSVYAVMWLLCSQHRGHEKHLLLGPRPVHQVPTADKRCPLPACDQPIIFLGLGKAAVCWVCFFTSGELCCGGLAWFVTIISTNGDGLLCLGGVLVAPYHGPPFSHPGPAFGTSRTLKVASCYCLLFCSTALVEIYHSLCHPSPPHHLISLYHFPKHLTQPGKKALQFGHMLPHYLFLHAWLSSTSFCTDLIILTLPASDLPSLSQPW